MQTTYFCDKDTGELLLVLGPLQLSSRIEGDAMVMTAAYPVLWTNVRLPEPEKIDPVPLEQYLKWVEGETTN